MSIVVAQTTLTDPQLVDWGLKQFGPPTVMLAVFVVGLLRKWWVLGWQYQELQSECITRLAKSEARSDAWQEIALRGVGLAETSVGIVKRTS